MGNEGATNEKQKRISGSASSILILVYAVHHESDNVIVCGGVMLIQWMLTVVK